MDLMALQHRSIAVSCFRVFVASTMAVSIGLSAGSSAAQEKTPPPVFRSGTRLIVETVTVKDKNGNVVEGLTAKDFTLTEDGEPQTISFVEFQRVQSAPGTPLVAAPPPGPAASVASPAAPPPVVAS